VYRIVAERNVWEESNHPALCAAAVDHNKTTSHPGYVTFNVDNIRYEGEVIHTKKQSQEETWLREETQMWFPPHTNGRATDRSSQNRNVWEPSIFVQGFHAIWFISFKATSRPTSLSLWCNRRWTNEGWRNYCINAIMYYRSSCWAGWKPIHISITEEMIPAFLIRTVSWCTLNGEVTSDSRYMCPQAPADVRVSSLSVTGIIAVYMRQSIFSVN
jgi:hypothetical protein